jgi:hypothetical protein
MAGVFAITESQLFDGSVRFKGKLLIDPTTALAVLTARLGPHGYYPLIRSDEELAVLRAAHPRERAGSRPWVNVLLLLATLVTTVFVGATNRGADPSENPWSLLLGLPFAVTLLSILGVHELGHYFTARRYGITVTLPYFIPAPVGLGTFGAFIKMKSPVTDRKALFDVGISGPSRVSAWRCRPSWLGSPGRNWCPRRRPVRSGSCWGPRSCSPSSSG